MSDNYEYKDKCRNHFCTDRLYKEKEIETGFCYWCLKDQEKESREAVKEYKAEQEYNARKAGDYDR